MIHWGDPRFLPWLWALVPLAALLFLLVARRERRLRLLLDDASQSARARRRSLPRVEAALWLAACALALVALARPQWGIRWQEERRRGLDVIVALDTSNSMLATDLKPNRMQRAKGPQRPGPAAPMAANRRLRTTARRATTMAAAASMCWRC